MIKKIDIVINKILVDIFDIDSFNSLNKLKYNGYSKEVTLFREKNIDKILHEKIYDKKGKILNLQSYEWNGLYWEIDNIFNHSFEYPGNNIIRENITSNAGINHGGVIRLFNNNQQLIKEEKWNEDYEDNLDKYFHYNNNGLISKIILKHKTHSIQEEIIFYWNNSLLERIEKIPHKQNTLLYNQSFSIEYINNQEINVFLDRKNIIGEMKFKFNDDILISYNNYRSSIEKHPIVKKHIIIYNKINTIISFTSSYQNDKFISANKIISKESILEKVIEPKENTLVKVVELKLTTQQINDEHQII